jgi:hypothetical protein
MAGRERYPLEAARTLREREEQAAREEMARRNAALVDAERAVDAAKARAGEHRAATVAIAAEETKKDGAGRRIADSLRARAYLDRRRVEQEQLDQAAARAEDARKKAAAVVEEGRQLLADARAAREAVEKHHEAWRLEQKKIADGREEAEVEDVIAGRRRG